MVLEADSYKGSNSMVRFFLLQALSLIETGAS